MFLNVFVSTETVITIIISMKFKQKFMSFIGNRDRIIHCMQPKHKTHTKTQANIHTRFNRQTHDTMIKIGQELTVTKSSKLLRASNYDKSCNDRLTSTILYLLNNTIFQISERTNIWRRVGSNVQKCWSQTCGKLGEKSDCRLWKFNEKIVIKTNVADIRST